MGSNFHRLQNILIKQCSFIWSRPISMCQNHWIQSDTDIPNENKWRIELHKTIQIYPNFITEEEETSLLLEIEPYIKKLRYEFSHWDDAIHGYRETEWSKWNENNVKIIEKIRSKAFPTGVSQLGLVHVLDLAEEGWIKPHVDSVKFCGDIIAGLSLLSDSVMKFTMVNYETEKYDSFLLPRRSLYIITGVARHKYNHEILKNDESYIDNQHIKKTRRISVICRSEPS